MAPPSSPTTALVDGESSIVVDVSPWPIVIATWFGQPTERLVEQYFAHHRTILDRAIANRERLILVTDTFATERPTPLARKRILELSAAQPEARELTLASYIVIESAIIRGVVTALAWVDPKMNESETVSSLPVALEKALYALREAGIAAPPIVPSRQARPARPSAA